MTSEEVLNKVLNELGLEENEVFKIKGANIDYKINSLGQLRYYDKDVNSWLVSDSSIFSLFGLKITKGEDYE